MAQRTFALGGTSDAKKRGTEMAMFRIGRGDVRIVPCAVKVESPSPQALGEDALIRLAQKRAEMALAQVPGSEVGIGIQNSLLNLPGILSTGSGWFTVVCAVIIARESGRQSGALSVHFPIPGHLVIKTQRERKPLEAVMGVTDPIAALSLGKMSFQDMVAGAVFAAAVPLLNESMYKLT